MKSIWAIGDLHLSFGIPNKEMDVFGEAWIGWTKKLEKHWRENIKEEDLVLIPGDISWAMHLEEALVDLEWINKLPGTKVMIRGNHDYWWSSASKINKVLPPSLHIISNDAYNWDDVSICGVRLWDSPEYNFTDFIEIKENKRERPLTEFDHDKEKAKKIFERELGRLEMSLKCLNQEAKLKIAMIHYPPIGADLQDSETSKLLEKYGINICVFGHLHNIRSDSKMFGEKNGIKYYLTSCDYLNFQPLKVR
jgi:predicted phosphohydrolase